MAFVLPAGQFQNQAVVQAVLFYSPTCSHCQHVITETLPPLYENYGEQLQLVGVDVTTEDGFALFQSAWSFFNLERAGVPFLAIGDRYLIGSVDIPEQLPGLIDMYLSQGGADWPAIPGMLEAIGTSRVILTPAAAPPAHIPASVESGRTITPAPTPGSLTPSTEVPGLLERIGRDPLGNSFAILVLAAMLASVGLAGFRFLKPATSIPKPAPVWVIPLLCLLGLGVAGYLTHVEITRVDAICGPVGDCNTVQQSRYARLFGVLPVGALGMFGFIAILAAWLVGRPDDGKVANLARLAQMVMTTFGILFSIYLTFLEPFVIGATCIWCLTSAVITTILFLLSIRQGKRALAVLKSPSNETGLKSTASTGPS